MFPISDATLPLSKIADYWSGEIRPQVSRLELLKLLESAWWRGEFVAQEGASRLSLIRYLYTSSDDFIFVVGDEPDPRETELPDGSVERDTRPLVRVPSTEAEDWNGTNCRGALEDLAARTPVAEIPALASVFAGIYLSHVEFFSWLERKGYARPTFWAPTKAKDIASQGHAGTKSSKRRGQTPIKRERVIREMLNEIEQGILSLAAIMHHVARFCMSVERARATDPTSCIGVRPLAVRRV
jgi:hypothetical protein